jgi:hypothetical protein
MPPGVKVGWVLYLCLKNTVSDTHTLLLSSPKFCGIGNVQMMFIGTTPKLNFLPMCSVSHCFCV